MRRLACLVPFVLLACSPKTGDTGGTVLADGGPDGSIGIEDALADGDPGTLDVMLDEEGGGSTPDCKGLQCKQVKCADGKTTAVTGTVWNPAKSDPLYNAVVYVPNAAVDPFKSGVTCEKCGVASGEPIVTALSGADGKFRLENMPVGTDIPLVIQIGRWRRQVIIPKVDECVDTALSGELTRLPKNKAEGDIPLTAIVTSTYDPTECILRKIGIDDKEFTSMTGTGRIHLFHGNGETLAPDTPTGDALWTDLVRLKKYDLVAFPCSSVVSPSSPDVAKAKQNIVDYAGAGGRVFATDLSYPWLDASAPAPFSGTASWGSGSTSNPFTIDTSFPKGKALADWLKNVGATTTYAQINLTGTYARSTGVLGATQKWIGNGSTVQHFTFNAPVGKPAESQCGRVVYSSFHIASGGGFGTFPAACTTAPLTPQEKVLEFMLFDLASCVQLDKDPPKPPPVK